jgi:hypothetical protein
MPFVLHEFDRLTSIYDFTTFVSKRVNPNLRGLGHTGWGETGNPTHAIRFEWNAQSQKTEMTYKLEESDKLWRPQLVYDSALREWRAATEPGQRLYYEVMSAAQTEELLQSTPAILVQGTCPSALRGSILRCATLFEG